MSHLENIDLIEKAKKLFLDDKIDQSKKIFQKVVNLEPSNQEANKFLGLICLRSEQKKDAWQFMKVALDADMENSESWVLFIHSLYVAEKYDDAKKIILIAEKNKLKSELVNKIKNQIAKHEYKILSNIISKKDTGFKCDDKESKDAKKFFSKKIGGKENNFIISNLHDLRNFRNYDELYRQSKELLSYFPDNAFFYELKGLSEMHLEKYEDCLKSYLKVEELLPPDNKVIKINIASAYLKLNKKKDAKKVLKDLLLQNPDFKLAEDLLNSIDNNN